MRLPFIITMLLLLSGCVPSSNSVTPTISPIQNQVPTLTVLPSPSPTANVSATQKAFMFATLTEQVGNARATSTEIYRSGSVFIQNLSKMLDEVNQESGLAEKLNIGQAKLILEPTSKTLRHNLENTVITYNPGLSLKNFIVSIKFVNPYDTSATGTWDYGILFRNNYYDDQYRLTILSNQSWSLMDARTWTNIFSRNDKHLTAAVGEENTLWLIVVDEKAYLFINGIFIQSLDVGENLSAGDISPATGLYYGNKTDRKNTEFYDFTVWSLP